MPRIIRTSGLNLSEDALKIRDITPFVVSEKARREKPDEPDSDGFILEADAPQQEDFTNMPAIGSDGYPVSDSSAVREEVIQSAMSEASRILEDAVRKAEEERQQRLSGIMQEAEQLRRQAEDEGRREGLEITMAQIKQTADDLEKAVARYEGQRAGFESEFEEQLKWMAIEIASKVLAKKVSEDDTEIAEMVQKAVAGVKNQPWVRVEVAQEMTGLIDRLVTLFDDQQNIEVVPIPAPAGTVQVETPSGIMDASLKTQLANLREFFAGSAAPAEG